jgi:site-specific recombinase XerD
VVQKVLGHRTLRTVEIYTHPTREELEAAMVRLD